MQEDGEPILDTGSHILAIINLIFNTSWMEKLELTYLIDSIQKLLEYKK